MIFFCNSFPYNNLTVSLIILKPTFLLSKRFMWLACNAFKRTPFYLNVPKDRLIPSIFRSPSKHFFHVYSYDVIDITQYNLLKEAYKHWIKQSNLTISPITESKTPLLLTRDKPEVVKGVSGIWQVPPKIRDSEEFSIKVEESMMKFTCNMFLGKPIITPYDLALRLIEFLKPSLHINTTFFYPLAQHIITSTMPLIKFPREVLEKITYNKVNYSFYPDFVTSQTVLETIAFQAVLETLPNEMLDNMIIIAQNPDNPLGSHKQYAEEAYKIMEQPHPDFVCIFKDPLVKEKLVRFFDIKFKADPLKSINTLRGFISFVDKFDDYLIEQFMKRVFGDYKGFIKQKSDLPEDEIQAFIFYIRDMEQVLQNKNLSIKEKYDEFKAIQNDVLIDPKIRSIIFSRIIQLVVDNVFDDLYKNEIKNNTIIDPMTKKIKIAELFPKKEIDSSGNITQTGQQINVIPWNNALKSIIDSMPENIKKMMLHNYYLYKMLEI